MCEQKDTWIIACLRGYHGKTSSWIIRIKQTGLKILFRSHNLCKFVKDTILTFFFFFFLLILASNPEFVTWHFLWVRILSYLSWKDSSNYIYIYIARCFSYGQTLTRWDGTKKSLFLCCANKTSLSTVKVKSHNHSKETTWTRKTLLIRCKFLATWENGDFYLQPWFQLTKSFEW